MKNLLTKHLTAITIFFLAITLIACQKDENASKLKLAEANNEMGISGSAVTGTDINGLITESAADRMKRKFNATYTNSNKTEYVSFSVKDIANYLDQLKKKYKSDSVYVSFGVYDEITAVDKKDIGRVTVFFLGKNNLSKKGDIRSQNDAGTDPKGSNYLNHGTLWP